MFRRGRLRLGFACTFACAPLLVACSLLLDDGFSDTGQPQPSGNDSGIDSQTAGGDGSTNPTPDGGGPPLDGALLFDGGKLACPDAAGILCDDFERDDVKGPWGAVSVGEAGTLVIGKPFTGESWRLEAAVSAAGSGAQLSKEIAVSPSKLHVELTLEILQLPTVGAFYITGALMFNAPNPLTLFYIYAHGGGAFVVEQLTDQTHYVQTPLAITLNAPHRVVMDIVAGGKVTVSVDGAVQVDKKTESWMVLKPPSAILGPNSLNGGNTFSMRADDYVFIAE